MKKGGEMHIFSPIGKKYAYFPIGKKYAYFLQLFATNNLDPELYSYKLNMILDVQRWLRNVWGTSETRSGIYQWFSRTQKASI